jgi:hypothetical protein
MRTTIYLPTALHRAVKIYAARHGTNVTQLVIEGLKLRLKERPAAEPANE